VTSVSTNPGSVPPDTVPPPGAAVGRGIFLLLQQSPQREALLERALSSADVEIVTPGRDVDIELLVGQAAPDVLVLDRAMPNCEAVCRALKSGPSHAVPIVVVDWEDGGEEAAVDALAAGADEYVGAPSHTQELRARVHNQLRHKRRLDALTRLRAERNSLLCDATLDSLTGVLNRKALSRALEQLERVEGPQSLVFLDLDLFKAVNDGFGHAVGDRVLAALGRLLRDHVRPSDVVGRYGGEEFVILLRDASGDSARRVADRIRQSIAGSTIAGLPHRVTVSAGVASRAPEEPISQLVARADLALYAAKLAGRNRVVLAPPASEMPPDSFASNRDPDTWVRAAAGLAQPTTSE